MKNNNKPYLQPFRGTAIHRTCPSCKAKRSFQLYLDGKTNKPINLKVGKCIRKTECGYHFTPNQLKCITKKWNRIRCIARNGQYAPKRPFYKQSYLSKKKYAEMFDYKPPVLDPFTGPESRHTCPACGEHSFAFYRSPYNNSEINDRVGKCDRVKESRYHLTSRKYFINLKKRY